MNKLFLYAVLSFLLIACGGSKKATSTLPKAKTTERIKNPSKTDSSPSENRVVSSSNINTDKGIRVKIVEHAKSFEGTRYKFGGTTKSGMDCSGLVYTAFKQEDILMPRISRDMAKKGDLVSLNDVTEGDLVFFKTNNKKTINHVGLVVQALSGEIYFIHSTTSRGVIISSMNEAYWKKAFVEVRRII